MKVRVEAHKRLVQRSVFEVDLGPMVTGIKTAAALVRKGRESKEMGDWFVVGERDIDASSAIILDAINEVAELADERKRSERSTSGPTSDSP